MSVCVLGEGLDVPSLEDLSFYSTKKGEMCRCFLVYLCLFITRIKGIVAVVEIIKSVSILLLFQLVETNTYYNRK